MTVVPKCIISRDRSTLYSAFVTSEDVQITSLTDDATVKGTLIFVPNIAPEQIAHSLSI